MTPRQQLCYEKYRKGRGNRWSRLKEEILEIQRAFGMELSVKEIHQLRARKLGTFSRSKTVRYNSIPL